MEPLRESAIDVVTADPLPIGRTLGTRQVADLVNAVIAFLAMPFVLRRNGLC